MRTDIHSEKNLKPEDYQVLRYFYTQFNDHTAPTMAWEVEEYRQEMEEVQAMLKDRGAMIHGGWSNCDHCGAYYHHGVLLEHIHTGELITVGWICAENRFSLDNITYERRRIEKVLKQIKHRRCKREKIKTFVKENRHEVRLITRHSKHSEFMRSLRSQLISRGELSEAQVDAVEKAAEYVVKRAEEQAARDTEPKSPAPEGRVVITGEIVHTKFQDHQYGTTFKMLVKCDGFRVWSTVPVAIESEDGQFIELKGRHVEFTATLEQSKDDETFAFAKRPTKASLLKEVA